ncbi:MAG TPA: HesA/MoeB/ThiF family protein [Candidatus Nanoarchaeia archaeon]|nr:HesA/MoeB/ThiF family protein [Candidatus Nanoarchaeia archaeon]
MDFTNQEKILGKQGQALLSKKTVCIVGLGALGSVSAELLTRAGISKLILIDSDQVEESNLHRQLLYTEKDIHRPKVSAALNYLQSINSNVKVETHEVRLTADNISLLKSDLILDGTDNLETRFIINDYAVKYQIPWIYAGAIQTRGFVFPVLPKQPCFECLLGSAISEEDCETQGILNTTNTIVASLQVVEAIKILAEQAATPALFHINAWDAAIEKIKVKKNPKCQACKGKFTHLQKKELFILHYCKTKAALEVKPLRQLNLDLEKIKESYTLVSDAGSILVVKVEGEEVIVHKQGVLMFKTLKDKEKAKELTEKIYETGLSNESFK